MVANYLTSTVFMIIILLILFVKICNDMKQEKMKRMYQVLDITVVLYVLLDAGFAVDFLEGRNQEPGFLCDHAVHMAAVCPQLYQCASWTVVSDSGEASAYHSACHGCNVP